MTEIIVAIICNLIAALVLVSGVLTSLKCGWKVALTKFLLVGGGAVGTFFLTPVLSDKLLGITHSGVSLETMLSNYNISQPTVNSIIFLALFLAFYGLALLVCKVVRHCLIKSMHKKVAINKAKIRRARSINPRAERAARRTAWREMKAEYNAVNNWWKKLISVVLHLIVSVALGIALLMPFGYIAKDINYNGEKAFLEKGYEYTLNGVIGDKFSDWAVHAKYEEVKEDTEEEQEPGVVIPEENGVETTTPEVEEGGDNIQE